MKATFRYLIYITLFVAAVTFWVSFVEYMYWYRSTSDAEPMSSVHDYVVIILYLLSVPLTVLTFVIFRSFVRRVTTP
jgi:flagellar basal body-associated protein FliL